MDQNTIAFNKVQKDLNTGNEYVPGKGVVPISRTDTPPALVTPPTTSLIDRYATEKNAIRDNPNYNAPAPDENAIRESYRQRNQQYVDAIRSQFDKYINEDTQAKADLTSRTYISNLASGMSGTVSGAGKEFKASETGDKKIRADIADREMAIQKVLQDGDLRASQEFDTRRKEYLNSAQDKYNAEATLNGNIKATAFNDITTLAGSGKSYDDLQKSNPNIIEQYKKETGLDDTSLKAYFLTKIPKQELVDPKGTQLSDGSIVYHQKVTDANGNISIKEVGRIQGEKPIQSTHITDNGVQILYKDGTYKTIGTPGNNKNTVGTPTGFTEEDIQKGKEILSRSGTGGYAGPGIYYAVYKKWIADGGSDKKFKELYPPEVYADPSRVNDYPTFLQPSSAIVKKETKTITPATAPTTATGNRTY